MTFVAGTVLTAAALNSELAAKSDTENPDLTGAMTLDGGSFSHFREAATVSYYLQRKNTGGTIVAANDNIGDIVFGGWDGTAYRAAARLRGAVDTTPGASDMPGRISLWTTADGGVAESERLRINNAGLISGTGPSLGAWTAYTPALTGTGWAIGNGVIVGAYVQIGKRIDFRIAITFGSTSTYGAGGLALSVPVTSTTNNYTTHGFAYDASAAAYYTLPAIYASTTTIKPQAVQSAVGLIQEVISTKPFTWAVSDQIYISGSYEAS